MDEYAPYPPLKLPLILFQIVYSAPNEKSSHGGIGGRHKHYAVCSVPGAKNYLYHFSALYQEIDIILFYSIVKPLNQKSIISLASTIFLNIHKFFIVLS